MLASRYAHAPGIRRGRSALRRRATYGWHAEKTGRLKVADGRITVSSGEPGLLATTSDFADYELEPQSSCTQRYKQRRVPAHARRADESGRKDCYELNIADPETSPFYTGSFVGQQKATEYLHSDDWQSFEVSARGGHFIVKVDGRQVLDYTDPAPLGRGRIGLQLNKGAVAFRNVKLRPLGLNRSSTAAT